jgi:hypothetical protein
MGYKICQPIPIFIKTGNNNGLFTGRPTWLTEAEFSEYLSEQKMF